MAIPNEGAAFILNALKDGLAQPSNYYIGVMTSAPSDTSTGASCNEVVAGGSGTPSGGTGTYNRVAVARANLSVATDTLSVAAGALPVEFTGFTHTGTIGYAGLFSAATNGTLLAYGTLTTGGRQLTNVADKLDLTSVTFQLT